MADFTGSNVVVVPLPVRPEMIVWPSPGPVGEIPYQQLEAAIEGMVGDVEQSVSEAEGYRTQAAASAGAAADSASAAATSETNAAESATDAADAKREAEEARDLTVDASQVVESNLDAIYAAPGHAEAAGIARNEAEGFAQTAQGASTAAANSATASADSATAASQAATTATDRRNEASGLRDEAESFRNDAEGFSELAEQYATEFGLSATADTGAPGSEASVTVTGDGPAYNIEITVPRGDKGEPGEISQAQLDAAVASLVDNAPEALDTLTELAAALGNDPNFATTVSTEIGKRVLIDGAPAEYNTLGKLVAALQNHELGGSTDASLLTGALTDQVNAAGAMVEYSLPGAGPIAISVMDLAEGVLQVFEGLESKSDTEHTHTVSDTDGLQAALDNKADQAALDAKVQLVTEFPSSPTPGVLYLKAED